MNNIRFYNLLLGIIFMTGIAFAQENRSELISFKTPLEFIPEKAFINIEYADHSVIQYQALIIPPAKKADSEFSKNEWLIGTMIKTNQSNPAVNFSIFLKGKLQENKFIPAMSIENSGNSTFLNSVDLIQQQILIKKQILESLQVQYNTQSGNLKRLRADAEVIANLGRIVEVVDEIEIIKSEIENLDKDLELLRSTFQAVKGMSQPKNYLRRELELTKQSDDLLKLVKTTESSEESRKNLSQEEVQAKLALIEETRYEDEDKLKNELIRLKTHAGRPKTLPLATPQGEQIKNYWDVQ